MNELILSNMNLKYLPQEDCEDITQFLEKYDFYPYSTHGRILSVLSKFNTDILIRLPNFNKYPEEFSFEFGKALVYLLNQSSHNIYLSYNSSIIFLGVRVAVKELCNINKAFGITDTKFYDRIDTSFHDSTGEVSRIYINDYGKIYRKDQDGNMLTSLPKGFHDIWHYSMAKLF